MGGLGSGAADGTKEPSSRGRLEGARFSKATPVTGDGGDGDGETTVAAATERRKTPEDRRRTHVADIAHDLKTPISIVGALLDRMRASKGLPTAVRADAEAARRQLATMAALLDELLDPERALVPEIELDELDCDLASVVLALVEGFEPIAAIRRIRLVYEGPARLIAVADASRLERVVGNLLANALRFTPFAGTVRVAIAAHQGTIHLEVADDGPGIPQADLERVFERSYRGTRSPNGGDVKPTGSGIGLATVKELVTLHGGTVRADRAPEGGALFVVELPFVKPRDHPGAHLPPR